MTTPQPNLPRSTHRARRRLAILLLLVAPLLFARESAAESLLSVLSYNVHGGPPLFTGDDPGGRVEVIASLASAYDVVLLQEDFEYHGVIRRRIQGKVGVAGNGLAFEPRRLAAKIVLAPASLFFAHFSPPYGAGLATFVKPALLLAGDVSREPYGVCDGWLGSDFDCWASKGYLRVGVRTAEGLAVDVYTTHLDAGHGEAADAARRRQLRKLASAVERESGDRAVIVGGDFNLAADRPGDGEVMVEFRDRLNLRDSGAGPELPFWRNRDYILYRSGAHARLSVEQAGEALEFVDGRHALSDHPAVYSRFRISALSGNADDDDAGECRPFAPRPRTVLQ